MSLLEKYLEDIQRSFFSCQIVSEGVIKPCLLKISWEEQELLINATVNNPLVLHYPIRKSYQVKFLQGIIEVLEKQLDTEVHDDIYDIFCNLMATPDEEKWFYKHYILDLNKGYKTIVSVKESASIVSEGTTGLCSWKAAHALAEYCLENPSRYKNKSILELSSGAGLLGLFVWAVCKPRHYIFSDCHPSVLKLLSENVSLTVSKECYDRSDFPRYKIDKTKTHEEINEDEGKYLKSFRAIDGSDRIDIMNLAWEDVETVNTPDCDIILASDVVFDVAIIPSLCKCIKFLLIKNSERNCFALVACAVRNRVTLAEFIREIESLDLQIINKETTKYCEFEEADKTRVEIFKINLKTQ